MMLSKKIVAATLLVCVTFFAQGQNKSDYTEESVFSFDDGQTNYTLFKVTPKKAKADGPSYYTKVVPAFKHKIHVLDEAMIDTIRDFEDPQVILAIDTLIDTEFRYAMKFYYTYDILSQELQNITDMAKAQGFDIVQTKFIIFWEEGEYAQFRLPPSEELEGTSKVCLSIKFRKNGETMEYPVLFAD